MTSKRRSHRKATTGCRTCKSRRKKCDETRPSCHRCLASGRECFYPCDPLSWTAKVKQQPLKHFDDFNGYEHRGSQVEQNAWSLICDVSCLKFSSDRERTCLEFFVERTGPELFGYFGSSFWFESVVRIYLSDGDATVKAAMVALGAAHRIRELDITPAAFQFCAMAQSAYQEALARLNNSLNSGAASSSIVVPLLLYAFELFWGNTSSARTHMIGWFKMLLSSCRKMTPTSEYRHYGLVSTMTIYEFFAELEDAIALLWPANDPPKTFVLSLSNETVRNFKFQDLRDVCHRLFLLLRSYKTKSEPSSELIPEQAARRKLIFELFWWNCAFAEFLKTQKLKLPPLGEIVVAALRIYREAACLLFFIHSQPNLYHGAQLGRSEDLELIQSVNALFSRIRVRARSLIEKDIPAGKRMQRPSLVIDSGISIPCLHDSQRLVSANLLRQLTAAVSTNISSCVDWRKWGAYSVAEKIADVEESLILPLVSEDPQCQSIAVEALLYMDDRQLLLRQCVPDLLDGALVWTEQWCSF